MLTSHWYTLHWTDILSQDHLDLLERQRLQREVLITESQINRITSHLNELKAKLEKLQEALSDDKSEESEEVKGEGASK